MFGNKKKNRIEKIDLIENGFQVNYDEEITQFQWSEIEKLTGFKVDRFTTDDICLALNELIPLAQLESNQTKKLQGWASSGRIRLASANSIYL